MSVLTVTVWRSSTLRIPFDADADGDEVERRVRITSGFQGAIDYEHEHEHERRAEPKPVRAPAPGLRPSSNGQSPFLVTGNVMAGNRIHVQLSECQKNRLAVVAARLGFKGMSTDLVVELAHELLDAGVYDDLLLAIIDAKTKCQAEVIPPLRLFLEHAGVPIPDRERAVWQLLALHIKAIVADPNEPFAPLDAMISEVYWDYGFDKYAGNYLGDSHGIHHLIGHYWLHDDLLDCPEGNTYSQVDQKQAIEELKKAIVRRAEDWIRDWSHMAENSRRP